MPSKSIQNSLSRLARMETAFLSREFLAPVVRGNRVAVRVAGVRCELQVKPNSFEGWGVFRPESHSIASIVRPATRRERQDYLDRLPAFRLVICSSARQQGAGLIVNGGDLRLQADGPVSVKLIEEAQVFDTIVARFDGIRFWFDQIDPRCDVAIAGYLRTELARMTEPKELDRPRLSVTHRETYRILFDRRMSAMVVDEQTRTERKLSAALAHAGAQLSDYSELGDDYRVAYTVDGRRHSSVVRRSDLRVQSAGICLSGEDALFDLSSLVGVLREGEAARRIVPWR